MKCSYCGQPVYTYVDYESGDREEKVRPHQFEEYGSSRMCEGSGMPVNEQEKKS